MVRVIVTLEVNKENLSVRFGKVVSSSELDQFIEEFSNLLLLGGEVAELTLNFNNSQILDPISAINLEQIFRVVRDQKFKQVKILCDPRALEGKQLVRIAKRADLEIIIE